MFDSDKVNFSRVGQLVTTFLNLIPMGNDNVRQNMDTLNKTAE